MNTITPFKINGLTLFVADRKVISDVNKHFVIRYQFTASFERLEFYYHSTTKIGLNLIHSKMCKNKSTYLIGAGKYEQLVGFELAKKHFHTVLTSVDKSITFRVRRGLKITFHGK